jgi:hypothetical protein
MLAALFWLKLHSHGRNNPPNVIEPTGMMLDTNDLSDKDKILWLKVANLANTCNETGDYVNPVLHASYASLASGFRVFKIENNSHLGSAQEPRISTGRECIDEDCLRELAGIANFDHYWCEGKPPANPIHIDKW